MPFPKAFFSCPLCLECPFSRPMSITLCGSKTVTLGNFLPPNPNDQSSSPAQCIPRVNPPDPVTTTPRTLAHLPLSRPPEGGQHLHPDTCSHSHARIITCSHACSYSCTPMHIYTPIYMCVHTHRLVLCVLETSDRVFRHERSLQNTAEGWLRLECHGEAQLSQGATVGKWGSGQ